MNHCIGWVGLIRGYRSGVWRKQEWIVVFDASGSRVDGLPGESETAVQIRYCELHGAPAGWKVLPVKIDADEIPSFVTVAKRAEEDKVDTRGPIRIMGRGAIIRRVHRAKLPRVS